jgi:hypothetical protein
MKKLSQINENILKHIPVRHHNITVVHNHVYTLYENSLSIFVIE